MFLRPDLVEQEHLIYQDENVWWYYSKIVMENGSQFMTEVTDFKYQYVSSSSYESVKSLINNNSDCFNLEIVKKVSVAAAGVAIWVIAHVKIHEIYNNIDLKSVKTLTKPAIEMIEAKEIVIPMPESPVRVTYSPPYVPKQELERRINVELALGEVLKAANNVGRLEVEEFRKLNSPPTTLKKIFQALCMIFQPENSDKPHLKGQDEKVWYHFCRPLMEHGTEFFKLIRNFKYQYMKLDDYLNLSRFVNENNEHFIQANVFQNCRIACR